MWIHRGVECPNRYYDAGQKGWVCPCLLPEEWEWHKREQAKREELRAQAQA